MESSKEDHDQWYDQWSLAMESNMEDHDHDRTDTQSTLNQTNQILEQIKHERLKYIKQQTPQKRIKFSPPKYKTQS